MTLMGRGMTLMGRGMTLMGRGMTLSKNVIPRLDRGIQENFAS